MSLKEQKGDDKDGNSWLRFSQNRPNASLYFHQAVTLLHSMDESMRCSLCRDIMRIPVSIQPCNHSFCNDCIHDKLGINIQNSEVPMAGAVLRCPVCQTKLDDSIDLSLCIVHNRNFEETVRHYRTLQPLLKQALQVSQRPMSASSGATDASAISLLGCSAKPTNWDKVRGETNNTGNKGICRKNGNSWIREQFLVKWSEQKGNWSFVCVYCNSVAITSKKKTGNASLLTEHITHRCTQASDEIKALAIENTRSKEAPNYHPPAAQQQAAPEGRRRGRRDVGGSWGNEADEEEEQRPLRGSSNIWIRDQFRVEWTEAQQTWNFLCNHCGEVATRSRDKVWNASILTGHILHRCSAATEEFKAEASSYTRSGRKRRKLQELKQLVDYVNSQADAPSQEQRKGATRPGNTKERIFWGQDDKQGSDDEYETYL